MTRKAQHMMIEKKPTIRSGVPSPGMAARLGPTVDERRGVEYHELHSKDLVNKFNARPMPFGWTVNPYRGCEMACRYCFARYTHEFLGLNDPDAFERKIYVKETDRHHLIAEFRRARKSGQVVALGTATDPYQPAEAKFEVTRRVLVAARDAGAVGAESNVLFLRPGTRESFLQFLAIDFPRLVPEYERLYRGSAYARSDYVREVEQRVRHLAAEVGLAVRRREDRPEQRAPRQLSLVW